MVILAQGLTATPTVTQNAAAILLYAMMGLIAYFLKQFADGVRETGKEMRWLRDRVIQIMTHLGIEVANREDSANG